MKKHYVTRQLYQCKVFTKAVCGTEVCTVQRLGEATYYKNHVTCENCRRTKVFRGVK